MQVRCVCCSLRPPLRCVCCTLCPPLSCWQACVSHKRLRGRPAIDSAAPGRDSGGGSAFTSYIAAADLQQAISKYRASGKSEAYYLLTAGHFYNGFTWRLKLTVKPPDPGSTNEMNIHVGLCWGIEVEGEGALPLSENAMVQVRDATVTVMGYVAGVNLRCVTGSNLAWGQDSGTMGPTWGKDWKCSLLLGSCADSHLENVTINQVGDVRDVCSCCKLQPLCNLCQHQY